MPNHPQDKMCVGIDGFHERLIFGSLRGSAVPVPDWLSASYRALRREILHPAYPCYFGTLAERSGDLYYSYVEGGDFAHLPATFLGFSSIVAAQPGHRHTLGVFFEPDPGPQPHEEHGQRFWAMLQHLLDEDPTPWPREVPRDPDHPLWEFTFAGTSFFVFAAAPTHRRRRSRNLGPGLIAFFQPRNAFFGVEAGTAAGARARRTIRERLTRWDGLPPHCELKDYGDSAGREWKQSFLPDGDEPVSGRCPLHLGSADLSAAGAEGSAPTLVDLLCVRAAESPDRRGFLFLEDGEREAGSLTWGSLDTRARAIAAHLMRSAGRGERALLLYPPGLEFVAAFFGCLYAGVVAVPAYPPRAGGRLERLRAVCEDARPHLVLTTAALLARLRRSAAVAPELSSLRSLATDELPAEAAEEWRPPGIGPESLALLQYTSGSTASPKGVMVRHRHLLHNEGLIRRAFQQSPDSVVVGWLPLYHDMGLIGNVLQPLYAGSTCVLMSPGAFLQRPVRWLEAISRYGGTTSGGPNFAYELCVRKIGPELCRGLDLRSWKVAFNGAEPVRADTLDRFAETFGPCGFDPRAFYPCYGLAEATLFVTGGSLGNLPTLRAFDTAALESHRVVPARSEAPGRLFVGCGRPCDGHRVVLADPETGARCPEGQVGEIWVAGPSVAAGYWNREEETERTFRARLADTGEGFFLRTGDLGVLEDGELFVTGRLKDLIIVRGRNCYPQDLELAAERSHPDLRPAGGAAFPIEAEGEERVVLVHEVEHGRRPDVEEVARRVRAAVAESQEVHLHEVVLLRAGGLPKTSSGKVRRRACRALYLEGVLEELGRNGAGAAAKPTAAGGASREVVLPGPERREVLLEGLRERLAGVLRSSPAALGDDVALAGFGLDSLLAVELRGAIEEWLGVSPPLSELLEGPSLGELADRLLEMAGTAALPGGPGLAAAGEPAAEFPLSYGQKALWFLQRLDPDSPSYQIATAVRLQGDLDARALRSAFAALVRRHAALRTTFHDSKGEPVQRVRDEARLAFTHEDASGWSRERLAERLDEEAWRPFDLKEGPLLRVGLFRLAPGEHAMVVAVHHLVADFWSLTVLARELELLLAAGPEGRQGPPLAFGYGDFVHWQQRLLAGARGDQLWAYWRERLAGELPVLEMPADRARPPVQTWNGSSQALRLGPDLTEALHALARRHGATLFAVLQAAFFALLHRHTGQDDLVCGSPAAGRLAPGLSGQVGYYVNPVVLRADLSGDPSFEELVRQVRSTVVGALDHQELPFALLAERLHPVRNPSHPPVFQVMFILQKSPSRESEGLGGLALGEVGARATLCGLEAQSLSLARRPTQFDLTLVMAELEGGLGSSLQYNSDLFDAATMARLLARLRVLLEGIAAAPERRIGSLPLLTAEERRQLLVDYNATFADIAEATVHGLIEAQVRRAPQAPAVVFEDLGLSYAELDRRANQLAHFLRGLGVGPEVPVAVHVERGLEMLVSLLGVLKAGGVYIPLDPSYPRERLAYILEDSRAPLVLTLDRLAGRLEGIAGRLVRVDADRPQIELCCAEPPAPLACGLDLAYVNYTSGSTGRPKGVQIAHRSVVNFFRGMDETVGCGPGDTLLAGTSISFDISVLELFWTLARGARVVLLGERAMIEASLPRPARRERPLDLSLFYFASARTQAGGPAYRLLLEGARLADRRGFAAVWTPERHFHDFGGLYPNPSVTSAALAMITERVGLRAGSVVLPLHDPLRVAEEWSVVDNLSGGRVGIAFASGWHADDFVFSPERYERRKEVTHHDIETVRRLWRGEAVRRAGGAGNEIEVRVLPRPVQAELPFWLTAAGGDDTFVKAGEIGANVLTHLLGQTFEEVARKVHLYREARARAGHDPETGRATLMLHTFVGEDRGRVRDTVRSPFTDYLRSSVGLIHNLVRSLGLQLDLASMSEKDLGDLLAFAFDRYFETSALFGDAGDCRRVLGLAGESGIDEVACLIDFGVETGAALASVERLAGWREGSARPAAERSFSLAAQARRHRPTLFQCTPSTLALLAHRSEGLAPLSSLRTLLVGGEALPPALAQQVRAQLGAQLVNVYGPTETTVWSTAHEVDGTEGAVPLGRPLANTLVYVLDRRLQPLPPGSAGEVCIGGLGLARGYLGRADLTADRFLPDPFSGVPGARMYRTGDLARQRPAGTLTFVGRTDHQVKIRGFRIELGEIQAVLAEHPGVREVVAVVRPGVAGPCLTAYFVAAGEPVPRVEELRAHLARRLPDYMMPQAFLRLDALPLTPNRKVDVKALPDPEAVRPDLAAEYAPPRGELERAIAAVWCDVLRLERVGVHDNFFDLGGHSLLMAQAQSRLREALRVDVPLVKLLEHPNVRSLARYLSDSGQTAFSRGESEERARRQLEGRARHRQRILQAVKTS